MGLGFMLFILTNGENKMKKAAYLVLCATVAVITLVSMPSAGFAEEVSAAPSYTLSGSLTAVSDYVFRGISQSDEHPAIQGSFDYAHDSGFYLGVWGSSVDFNDGDEASLETDIYAGLKGQCKVTGITWDLGATYFAYPGANSGLDYDYVEAKAGLGYEIGSVSLDGNVNYSPEFFADSGDAWYSQGNVTWNMPQDFSLKGHLGYQAIDDEVAFGVPDYTDWSLGLGYSAQGFDFGLAYTDTDLSNAECRDNCDPRLLFSISRSFN